MPNPRYRPRGYALDGDRFGKAAEIEWRTADDLTIEEDDDQLAAAQLQHVIALSIRGAYSKRHMSRREFADYAGIPDRRLGEILNGDTIMRLEHIALAQRALGLSPSEVNLLQTGPE